MRSTLSGVSLAILTVAAGAQALAAEQLLYGSGSQSVPSYFTLDFGQAGGVTSANIALTDFTLSIDPQTRRARMVDYYQEVEPLTLPGGFSTGDITIQTMPEFSFGKYDAASGAFVTIDYYVISFTGDLSAFGLTSPAILPGTSNGVVTFSDAQTGEVVMEWAGKGWLQNPGGPNLPPVRFRYTCDVTADFVVNP
ncbi:hypothetical protein RAS1_40210 [Phycisphaerae bacterium RAS1]|nr:hypothetical protein RAS1_40210 [Phycisphaerae bacterium RAS1]